MPLTSPHDRRHLFKRFGAARAIQFVIRGAGTTNKRDVRYFMTCDCGANFWKGARVLDKGRPQDCGCGLKNQNRESA